MFLSKILYDRRRWDVIHDLEDRDRLHKKMLKLFPDYPGGGRDNARELMGVLFRVEQKFIIMQSKLAPSSTRLSGGYAIEGTKDVTTNYASIREGAVYRFRLDANTSMKVLQEDGDWIPNLDDASTATRTRTKRKGCGNFAERQRWFELRTVKCGFATLDFSMDSLPILRVTKGSLEATRFEGRLKVLQLEPFLQALHGGIGQGKPYGLGMISIRNA